MGHEVRVKRAHSLAGASSAFGASFRSRRHQVRMNEEIELKLALQPEHVGRLRRHPVLRALKLGRGSTKRLVSTYYDTPSFTLMRNKVALRVRQVGRERIQTIKRENPDADSMLARGEWEHSITGDRPDISRLEDADLRRLIEPHQASGELNPVFTTEITRQTWPLRLRECVIECALDVGEIKANGTSQSLCEVEFELKAGEPGELFELAREINRTVPLRLEPTSKAARGYSLLSGTSPAPRRGDRVRLRSEMTVREGIAAVARACIDHIVANVDSAHHGADPEGVHQLRVGIRRLRAALVVFRDVIPGEERLGLAEDLRWLQRELGPAREWDVLIDETMQPAAERLAAAGLQDLMALAEQQRALGYERARRALGEPRYTDLLLRLEGWIDGRRWSERETAPAANGGGGALEAPLPGFAAEVLHSRQAKADKLGRHVRKLDLEALHKLRIRVKKLRYATEFFRDLYPEKAAKRYIASLKELQDTLGNAHDAAIAAIHIEALEAAAGSGGERAAALLQGWIAANLKRDRKRLVGEWQDFAARKPFWKGE
jgi:triphosphatase